jgi:hypothetical protein
MTIVSSNRKMAIVYRDQKPVKIIFAGPDMILTEADIKITGLK